MHHHSQYIPSPDCKTCLRMAISSHSESGLTQKWRLDLAVLEGDASRCKRCNLLLMNENMIAGYCPECSETCVITELGGELCLK